MPIPRVVLREGEEYGAAACLARVRKEVGTPYFAPLVLAALISLRTTCSRSAHTRVGRLAVCFRKGFRAYGLETMEGWRPGVAFSAALLGQISGFSQASAMQTLDVYLAVQRDQREWLAELSAADRQAVEALLLPPIDDPHRVWRHAPARDVLHPGEAALSERLDHLAGVYETLELEAERRWRFLCHLEEAGLSGAGEAELEGSRFRFWRIFVPGRVETIVEYLGSGETKPPWFIELLANNAILVARRTPETVAWLQARGLPSRYLRGDDPGVLRPEPSAAAAARQLWHRTGNPSFPLSPLMAAGLFGHLALQVMLSCGARASEVAQLTEPQWDRGVWSYPGIAKGAKSTRFPLFPDNALASEAAARLKAHYRLAPNQAIPEVHFRHRECGRPPARYLFQWRNRHLHLATISACYRFLLFGLVRAAHGDVPLHTHLFRHAGANYLHRRGVNLGAIGALFNHEDVRTTYGYARPTASQCLQAAVEALRRLRERPARGRAGALSHPAPSRTWRPNQSRQHL
jgi:hypothetical protein